ncbi:MAG: dihydropteroate synthase [Thermoplasmata archaeon]|nr:dihydropteroate synthase [Thermoplasmata archaeon]
MERQARIVGAGRALPLDRPVVMGIVNATPDSFHDGGRYNDPVGLTRRIDALIDEGADIIDVGGESTRPHARPVPGDVELGRVMPAIEHAVEAGAFVSVDTRKATVAMAAVEAGAHMVNSVSGIGDDDLRAVVADAGAAVVTMHMRGEPGTMQDDPRYDDVVSEVRDHLAGEVALALGSGIRRECIVVDPGIGFGKTAEHNLLLLGHLGEIASIGQPVLVGPSRKSFIGAVLDLPPEERLEGTLAACVVAYLGGASVFRVHDVAAARRALDVAHAIMKGMP